MGDAVSMSRGRGRYEKSRKTRTGSAAPSRPCCLMHSLAMCWQIPWCGNRVFAAGETGLGVGPVAGRPCSETAARLQWREISDPEMLTMTTPSESVEIYCLKCRAKTPSRDVESVVMKNGRPALKAVCAECGTGKYRIGSTG